MLSGQYELVICELWLIFTESDASIKWAAASSKDYAKGFRLTISHSQVRLIILSLSLVVSHIVYTLRCWSVKLCSLTTCLLTIGYVNVLCTAHLPNQLARPRWLPFCRVTQSYWEPHDCYSPSVQETLTGLYSVQHIVVFVVDILCNSSSKHYTETSAGAFLVSQYNVNTVQTPFKKPKGLVQAVLFHPSRPFIFVAVSICT